jgi:microcystin-dependent protein
MNNMANKPIIMQDGITLPVFGDGLNPTGAVIPFAGAAAPTGYLLCNGAAVSRTTYAALFAVLSTTFGVGDGSTTFNVPDMRETSPVGVGTRGAGVTAHDTYTLGQFKDDQMQGHYHRFARSGSGAFSGGGVDTGQLGSAATNLYGDGGGITEPTTDGTNGAPRLGTTTHAKQIGLNYIIKT